MERQIRRGGERMPGLSTTRLPEPQMQALLAYLESVKAVRTSATP